MRHKAARTMMPSLLLPLALLVLPTVPAAADPGGAAAPTSAMGTKATACFERGYPPGYGAQFIIALRSQAEPPADLRKQAEDITAICLADLGLPAERDKLLGPFGLAVASMPEMAEQLRAAGLDPAIADLAVVKVAPDLAGQQLVEPPAETIEAIVADYNNAGVKIDQMPIAALELLGMYFAMAVARSQSAQLLGF